MLTDWRVAYTEYNAWIELVNVSMNFKNFIVRFWTQACTYIVSDKSPVQYFEEQKHYWRYLWPTSMCPGECLRLEHNRLSFFFFLNVFIKLAIRIFLSFKLICWRKECIAVLRVTWWGRVHRRNLDFLIAGPLAGSASLVLAARCPVTGEVMDWGAFPVFDDVLHTYQIRLLGHMESSSLRAVLG